MTSILILGGYTERLLTKHLLKQTDDNKIIAGRHVDRSENGQQIQVEARCEHEDGYELTAIPVVDFLMQYNKVRRPGLHMMGHLAEPNQLFNDMESLGVKVTNCVE